MSAGQGQQDKVSRTMSVYEEYFVKASARYIPIILIKNHKFNILTQT